VISQMRGTHAGSASQVPAADRSHSSPLGRPPGCAHRHARHPRDHQVSPLQNLHQPLRHLAGRRSVSLPPSLPRHCLSTPSCQDLLISHEHFSQQTCVFLKQHAFSLEVQYRVRNHSVQRQRLWWRALQTGDSRAKGMCVKLAALKQWRCQGVAVPAPTPPPFSSKRIHKCGHCLQEVLVQRVRHAERDPGGVLLAAGPQRRATGSGAATGAVRGQRGVYRSPGVHGQISL